MALVTATVAAGAIFIAARCPQCQSQLMAVPGPVVIEVRIITSEQDRTGRGRVLPCRHRGCRGHLCEVIEHR